MECTFRKTGYIFVAAVIGMFASTNTAFAYTSCIIDPFTTQISQGDSANLSVSLTLDEPSTPYELSLGNLPNGVTGGFSQVSSVGLVKYIPLMLLTKPDAQTGSFMITLIAKSALATTTSETSCQFNLNIAQRSATANTAALQSIPADNSPKPQFTNSVGAGALSPTITESPVAPVTQGDATTSAYSTPAVPAATAAVQPRPLFGQITERLHRGSHGAQVLFLQKTLQALKFFPASETPTGYFGTITENALKAFQTSRNLESIGIVGPLTRKALSELAQ